MATNKVERLMNLVICLLSTSQYLSADHIRSSVIGYQDSKSTEAFNRMFERDKNELRDLGIPVETGRTSGFTVVDGYRINRSEYELPDISLDPDEAAAVALAAALWDSPELAASSHSALMKLRAAGVQMESAFDENSTAIHSSTPQGIGSPAVLGSLLSALDESRPVRFEHRPGPTSPHVTRTVEPWGVVTHIGRWYLVGHDRDREQTRTYRLTRILSVTPFGKVGELTRPANIDLRQIVADAVDRSGPVVTARVWVAENRAAGLRRIATSAEPGTHAGRAGSILNISMKSTDGLTRQVLAAGTEALVLEPPELRDNVISELHILSEAGE
ncbi:YafY family protein [Nocardia sp. 348MFTsu5.1]|uniref:helix-turn-helix transcriptional regulator n=1 Tax=Nocardia sp. 348MFTsu5.1 TaxID=1172185 RepID=UPI00036075BF|nr:WYL domain-containing protein [Nocardia sp. 348MFTsu5.1]